MHDKQSRSIQVNAAGFSGEAHVRAYKDTQFGIPALPATRAPKGGSHFESLVSARDRARRIRLLPIQSEKSSPGRNPQLDKPSVRRIKRRGPRLGQKAQTEKRDEKIRAVALSLLNLKGGARFKRLNGGLKKGVLIRAILKNEAGHSQIKDLPLTEDIVKKALVGFRR